MEGGEGWRMIRCGGGGEDKCILNQIMLRFRPIAPKPVAGASGSCTPPEGKSNVISSRRRTKRKYGRVKKSEKNGKEKVEETNKRVVTLQLLPEIEKSGDYGDGSTDGGSSCCEFDSTKGSDIRSHEWLSLSEIGRQDYMRGDPAADRTAVIGGEAEMSWVTVECVTGTCMKAAPPQGFGILTTDEERVRSLEFDSCPGFVSDGWNRIMWLNGAFRRMVTMTWRMPEIAVWLAMREELPYTHSAFTCQVKLRYTTVGNNNKEKSSKEKYFNSQMVPCDLWRMDGGGFAWRLDVKAALTLAVDAAPLHI